MFTLHIHGRFSMSSLSNLYMMIVSIADIVNRMCRASVKDFRARTNNTVNKKQLNTIYFSIFVEHLIQVEHDSKRKI